MISINATLILQVMNIIILIYILNRLMFRPILKLTRERVEYFRTTKNEIKKIGLETERLKEEFVSVQRDARKDASDEAAQIRGQGKTVADEHLEESKKIVGGIRDDAEKEAEEKSAKTRPFLKDEALTLADEISERLVGRRFAG